MGCRPSEGEAGARLAHQAFFFVSFLLLRQKK